MKLLFTFTIAILLLGSETMAQDSPEVLIGKWKLDMSPHKSDDNNFAMMEIKSVKDGKMSGIFYREGVKLKNGNINTLTGKIYGALSGENSGSYNTSFYYEDGKLYGTTHAVDRDFLAVSVATKDD